MLGGGKSVPGESQIHIHYKPQGQGPGALRHGGGQQGALGVPIQAAGLQAARLWYVRGVQYQRQRSDGYGCGVRGGTPWSHYGGHDGGGS